MKLRKSVAVPSALLVYLAVMCYIGRGELAQGNYMYYFSITGITLVVIFLLFLVLRARERDRARRLSERRRLKAEADAAAANNKTRQP